MINCKNYSSKIINNSINRTIVQLLKSREEATISLNVTQQ